MHRIVLIEGDGIGPEITAVTKRVVDALGLSIEWIAAPAGASSDGDLLPQKTIDVIREVGVALKGPLETPVGGGYRSLNVALRKALGLYANVRPAKSYAGVPGRLVGNPNINLVVVRENTEDLYIGHERRNAETAIADKVITEDASEQIAKFAFLLAERQDFERVTTIHKANILKETDGLFLSVAQRIAARYPKIPHDDLIVDNAMQQLLRKPETFGVLLCPNLYGDIISDLTGTLTWGSIGLGGSGQYGDGVAVFEAVHGTAPDIAGKGLANPTALMSSAVMLLEHLEEKQAAERMRAAIERVYAETDIRTGELGGNATTNSFAEAVLSKLK